MATQRERDVILNLLDVYKDLPYLWNKTHPEYKNKALRHDGYRVMLEIYKNHDQAATIKTIKKKIENLRTSYFKEAKKVNSSKHTGAGSEDVYMPTLWYFDALTFLGCTTESCRPITDSLENVADENENLSSSEGESSQAGPSSAGVSFAAKKKKRSIVQQQENILASAEKLMSMKEEEWEVLGKSIGLQLRDLKSSDLTIAQKLISDVIFYAKMGRLSEDTHIDLGSDRSSSSPLFIKHDQDRRKLSHPSPQYIVLSPSQSLPSPQYHNSSPQYCVQSPNASHPSQFHIPESSQTPQFHIPESSQTPQIHILESSYTLPIHIPEHTSPIHIPESTHIPPIHISESSHTPQIHIPESSHTPQIHIPESSYTPQIHIPEHTSNTHNNSGKKINIKELLIFKPNK